MPEMADIRAELADPKVEIHGTLVSHHKQKCRGPLCMHFWNKYKRVQRHGYADEGGYKLKFRPVVYDRDAIKDAAIEWHLEQRRKMIEERARLEAEAESQAS
jgi:hypothetical protein